MFINKLVDWIDPNSIDWNSICYNKNAYDYIKRNIDKMNLSGMIVVCKECNDKYFFDIFQHKLYDIDKSLLISLCTNPAAVGFIIKNLTIFNSAYLWKFIYRNPKAIHIIEYAAKHNIQIPNAGSYLIQVLMNPSCSKITETMISIDLENIDLSKLCESENITALKIVEVYKAQLDDIDWMMLCENRSLYAMKIIEDNLDLIIDKHLELSMDLNIEFFNGYLDLLVSNPNVFSLLLNNYDKISKSIKEEKKFIYDMCVNPNPKIFKHFLLYKDVSKVNAGNLVHHSDIDILQFVDRNIHTLYTEDWIALFKNKNALWLVEKHKDKIRNIINDFLQYFPDDYYDLLEIDNYVVLDIIREHIITTNICTKANMYRLSKNPSIFKQIDFNDIVEIVLYD